MSTSIPYDVSNTFNKLRQRIRLRSVTPFYFGWMCMIGPLCQEYLSMSPCLPATVSMHDRVNMGVSKAYPQQQKSRPKL